MITDFMHRVQPWHVMVLLIVLMICVTCVMVTIYKNDE